MAGIAKQFGREVNGAAQNCQSLLRLKPRAKQQVMRNGQSVTALGRRRDVQTWKPAIDDFDGKLASLDDCSKEDQCTHSLTEPAQYDRDQWRGSKARLAQLFASHPSDH